MTKVLTVYKKHPCVKCDMTIKYAKKLGYKVIEEELFNKGGELNVVPKYYKDTYDFTTSPIVTLSETDDEESRLVDYWCDFRIDLLNKYA